jgi:hypothetical protein
VTRTLRNAMRWLMGEVEEPDVPESETRVMLRREELSSRRAVRRREDFLESAMVYAEDQQAGERENDT